MKYKLLSRKKHSRGGGERGGRVCQQNEAEVSRYVLTLLLDKIFRTAKCAK